jgi:16S rRNA (uracil1498-N3)-methyltransferase
MIRLFVPHDLAEGAQIALDPGQSRYLAVVMRQGPGDSIRVFNGRDGEWQARIATVAKRGVALDVDAQARPQTAGPDLDLVVALVKRARLEVIVEKAAELGARRVRLAVTERTNADHARLDRLAAIAADVPEILPPMKIDRLLAEWDGRPLVFCDEAGDATPMLDVLAPQPEGAAILIGPEGGFSPAERERLRALPFATPVSLGPRILRADTAAIAALSLWQAAAGDWRA